MTQRENPGRRDWKTWPHYNAAASGFRGYWYPATWSMPARMVPRGQLYVMDLAGHHLQEERPAEFHAVAGAFLGLG